MEELLQVGIITSTHGIKGEVKVYPTTDDIKRFSDLKECILDTGKQKIEMTVEGCKYFKNQAILKFKNYDNINDVEAFKQATLWVTRENAVPLLEGEFYIADIMGAEVITDTGKHLGTLTEVMETGANDVYVVKTDAGKEILIPAIPDCLVDVDVDNKKVTVHLLPGLVD